MEVAPKTREDVTFVELEGEGVVYDEKTDTLHHLNPSATIVWSSCDGTTTPVEIAGTIADAFDLKLSDVLPQVNEVIELFDRAGLLARPSEAASVEG